MNCQAPILEPRCHCCAVAFPSVRCVSCDELVCRGCLDDWPGWVGVCRSCAELELTTRDEAHAEAWLKSFAFALIAILVFGAVVLAVSGIAKVLDHLLGGAQ